MREILLYFAVIYDGDWEKINKALLSKEKIDVAKKEEIVEKYKGMYVTIFDIEYPKGLKRIKRPPYVIFYLGDYKLVDSLNKVWSLSALPLTEEEKEDIQSSYKEHDFILVTGYSTAMERDLFNLFDNRVIAVKDGGIKNTLIISKERQKEILEAGGLIISEYPGYAIPNEERWQRSNDLKIGLSNNVLFYSTIQNKTIFNVIINTIENNKDVYCMYDNNIEGENFNNTLIEKGAYSLNNIEELKY